MARFEIKSKDGNSIRYSGKPRYNGSYLKPSFLEFSEIASSTPIQWEVGDYVDYPRTGMRYRLYSIPQPSKNARKGARGNSFTYSNVQFHSATKELEIALFRDLVDNDNNIHFSTSPDVATFENVEGIIRRIQACMNDLYPDRWEVRLASFDAEEDAETIERISEPKDFALSGGTCLDALSKIYDLWDGIGWFHSHENGKEIITVGYANTRNAGNTTESYLYGKGNGLTAIKKHQTNKEEFATRLYIYGSERNLPARYYNEKNILNAESVDIRNLMLPLEKWGKTNGLPDARKAYLENAEAVAKFGIIPKVHYFDSVDSGADIYPSIEGMTIGRLRKALEALGDLRYYPSASLYPDGSKRVDEVRSCENPDDAGVMNSQGRAYDFSAVVDVPFITRTVDVFVGAPRHFIASNYELASYTFRTSGKGKVTLDPDVHGYVADRNYSSVKVKVQFANYISESAYQASSVMTIAAERDDYGNWAFDLPKMTVSFDKTDYDEFPARVFISIEATLASPGDYDTASFTIMQGSALFGFNRIVSKEFTISLKQIGFDISERASLGNGKVISMKSGMCEGRNFVISSCKYIAESDSWTLVCKRQRDDTLGLLFPNTDYEISAGDRFVLLDIAMPETYVYAASDRLLAEGEKLLARASRIQNHYEPAIDAKVMIESGRTLREGMFMSIEDEDVVDNTTDYIIIDTLSIYEDESAIPTYRVTLRERRKVTYKGTPSATSSTDTQPVEKETNETTAPSFESFWEEDENGNVFTTRQIRIKNNLIVDGDTASGGNGDPGTVVGATSVVVDGVSYPAVNGVIDMSKAFDGLSVDVDLSDYYTKNEVNELIDGVTSGDIDLANYYTKSQVDDKFDAIDFSPYAKKTDVEGVETRVSTLEKAGYATKGYVDTSISALVNGAPSTLDTLKEIADAFEESQDVIDALDKAIGTKASQTSLDSAVERIGTLESTLKTEQGNIDTLEGYFASGIAKKATADAKGNVIDTYYTPIATHNAFKESTNASLALKATASDLSALAGRVTANEGSIASLQSGKADKATTLAGYGIKDAYTTTQVDEKISDLDESKADKTELEKYLLLEAEGQTIKGNIRIEGNLVVTGDTATGGEAGSVPIGITGILVDGMTYRDKNADGLVDITEAFEGLQEKIDLTNYYTRVEVDAQVDAINNEVSNKASQSDLDKVSGRVATLENAGYATQTYVNTAIGNLNIGQYATKTYVGEQITALNIGQYLKSATAESTYAKITSLTAVDNRLKGIEAYFATSEDAGTQIDKWNEIVAFLDATEGTTLAGILEAYTLKSVYEAFVASTNTALADRYTKAQIDGKITTINNSITSVDNKYASTKTWADTLASLIVNENGNIRIKTNLIVNGDTASGGGSGESAIGITGILLNGTTYRDENGDGIIDLGTITSGLTSVNWSDVQGRPTALSQFNNDLGLGTLAYKNGLTASEVGALSTSGGTINGDLKINSTDGTPALVYFYVAGSGRGALGCISAGPVYYDVNSNGYDLYHTGNFNPADYQEKNTGVEGGNGYVRIPTSSGGGAFIFYSGDYKWSITNEGWNGSRYLLHAGNYSDYALPLTGGIMKDAATIQWGNNLCSWDDVQNGLIGMSTFKEDAAYGYYAGLSFKGHYGLQLRSFGGNSSSLEFRGFNGANWGAWKTIAFTDSTVDKAKSVVDASGNALTLIHSGNIGSYNAGSANALTLEAIGDLNSVTDNRAFYSYFQALNRPASNYATGISLKHPELGYKYQLVFDANGGLFTRYYTSSWQPWKTIAFTDSNVASATYAHAASALVNAQGGKYVAYVSGNTFYIGDSIYPTTSTHILGNDVRLRYGANASVGLFLNSSGNVTIGASDLAGASDKLYVDGHMVASWLYFKEADGTYSSYVGRGSSNSDIYLYSKATLKMYAGSSAAMIINSSGNVTIGDVDTAATISGCKLFVGGDTYVGGKFTLKGKSGVSSDYVITNQEANGLHLYVAGNTGTFFAGNGNVLIGTTTDDGSGAKLQVAGNAVINGGLSGVGLLNFSAKKHFCLNDQGHFVPNDKTSTDYWWGVQRQDGNYAISVDADDGDFLTRYTTYLAISSGNVLIGTTTDSGAKLQVKGNIDLDYYQLRFTGNSDNFQFGMGADNMFIYQNWYGHYFTTNGAERMRITSGGNVGIGTTNPSYKLDVAGDVGITSTNGSIEIDNGRVIGNATLTMQAIGTTHARIQTSHFGVAYTCPLYINPSGGNVLIGTTTDSGAKLQVAGNISINSYEIDEASAIRHYDNGRGYFVGRRNSGLGVTDGGLLLYSYGATPISLYTNGGERIRITSGGNVGIGVDNPAYKLEVNGDVRINGNLIVDGDTASGGSAGTTSGGVSILTINGNIPVGSSVSQSQLDAIGFTSEVLTDLMNGKYVYVKNIRSNGSFSLMALSANGSTIYMKEGSENFEMIEYVFYKSSSTTWRIEVYEV